MNKNIKISLVILLVLVLLSGCGNKNIENTTDNGKLKVVATSFPPYDFAREIGQDKIELKMLIAPGTETHSYEPSPQDIIAIQNSDLFIYVGGESDTWIDRVLKDMNKNEENVMSLMDFVEVKKEELVEGMEEDNHDHEHDHIEYDEHVWTSPKNAKLISEAIESKLSKLDSENSSSYKENYTEYKGKLDALDEKFTSIVKNGSEKPLVFADRFPFLYFAKEYNLKYYGAFSGCSTEVEASPATIKFLIDKVNSDKIPVVFYIEFSNEKMADIVVESTNAKKMLFHSAHNVTKKDFDAGVSYLDIMNNNALSLEEALK